MKYSLKVLTLGFVFHCAIVLSAQSLTGTHSIGAEGEYSSFNEAVDALSLQGVSGAVTFLVAEGIYEEQVTIPPISDASAANSITFKADPDNEGDVLLNYSASLPDSNWVVKLDTAQHVIFQGLKIQALGNSYARVFHLEDDADHISIIDNEIIGNNTYDDGTAFALIYAYTLSDGQSPDSTVITGNTFSNGSRGISMDARSSSRSLGTVIEGNAFSNQYYFGIFLDNHVTPVTNNNRIDGLTTAASSYKGIRLSYCTSVPTIIANTITAAHSKGGIYIDHSDGTSEDPLITANNVISIGGDNYAYGIYVDNSDYVQVNYNSVHITSTHTSRGQAFKLSSGHDVVVKNNQFINSGGG